MGEGDFMGIVYIASLRGRRLRVTWPPAQRASRPGGQSRGGGEEGCLGVVVQSVLGIAASLRSSQ
jgi:hypothetical protein